MREAARRGSAAARKALAEIPDYPEDFEYLVEWVYQLHGRSGVGFGSMAPLSYVTIKAWQETMGIEGLEPQEVEALIYLDSILLTNPDKETKPDDQPTLPKEQPPWPSKKEA